MIEYGPRLNLVRPSSSCLACQAFNSRISTSRSASWRSLGGALGSGSSPSDHRTLERASSSCRWLNRPLANAHCWNADRSGLLITVVGTLRVPSTGWRACCFNAFSISPRKYFVNASLSSANAQAFC